VISVSLLNWMASQFTITQMRAREQVSIDRKNEYR
jgi:hypothetical protein